MFIREFSLANEIAFVIYNYFKTFFAFALCVLNSCFVSLHPQNHDNIAFSITVVKAKSTIPVVIKCCLKL